ncbi:MAG: hypothetical protein JWM05_2820 [Acidimicrobiales bacterium]|nr:hypothetical protein [Acidimicrobiales bacterium]
MSPADHEPAAAERERARRLPVLPVVIAAAVFAALTAAVLVGGPTRRFDLRVASTLNDHVYRHPALVSVLKVLTRLGGFPVLAPLVVAAAVVVWRQGRRRIAAYLVVAPAVGSAIDSLVKLAVHRARPHVAHPIATASGKSFPSGHAMSSTVAYGALLIAFLTLIPPAWRRVATVATAALIVAIGCTRLLLGVHFVTDVAGGFVLGGLWLAVATSAFAAWPVDHARRPEATGRDGADGTGDGTRPSDA